MHVIAVADARGTDANEDAREEPLRRRFFGRRRRRFVTPVTMLSF
jgi:hypothetical protein